MLDKKHRIILGVQPVIGRLLVPILTWCMAGENLSGRIPIINIQACLSRMIRKGAMQWLEGATEKPPAEKGGVNLSEPDCKRMGTCRSIPATACLLMHELHTKPGGGGWGSWSLACGHNGGRGLFWSAKSRRRWMQIGFFVCCLSLKIYTLLFTWQISFLKPENSKMASTKKIKNERGQPFLE